MKTACKKKTRLILVAILTTWLLSITYLLVELRSVIRESLPTRLSYGSVPKGLFMVPYRFDPLYIPPSSRESPLLVGNLQGKGVIQSMAFHADYYGIAVGYSVDGGPINWINNGHCLKEWGGDSLNAKDMPVRLLSWKDEYDLQIAVQTPILFQQEFKLYFHNSNLTTTYRINSLHLYGYFENLEFGEQNQLKL